MTHILVVPSAFWKLPTWHATIFIKRWNSLSRADAIPVERSSPGLAGSSACILRYHGDSSAPGTSCRARSGMLRSAPATSAPSNLPFSQSAPGRGAGWSWGRTAMQPSPRRRSAVSIFSHFFQGRRHSSSDPLLRLSQRRRSSVVELLSSSTHRVMVALSSLSPEELDATFPEKKSKVLFIETVGSSGYFLGITILLFC